MMFLGLFTIVALPLFLFVSARMLATGDHGHDPITKVGIYLLYIMTAVSMISGLVLVLDIM